MAKSTPKQDEAQQANTITDEQIIAEQQSKIETLQKENEGLMNQLSDTLEQNEAVELTCEPQDTRKAMLIAMSSKLDLNFAQNSAQRIDEAVKVAMEVWGIE